MPGVRTLVYIYTETPLHAGVGPQTDSPVDLPIQRDREKNPIIRASSLKGSLRSLATASRPAEEVTRVFGSPPGTPEEEIVSSPVALGDARTLLFPVRSLRGTFAWVTGVGPLAYLQRDATSHGVALPTLALTPVPEGEARVASDTRLREPRGHITLEDLTFRAQTDPALGELGRWLAERVLPVDPAFAYWRQKVQHDVVLLPDDAFRYFVTHSTEVASRIRVDPQTGAAAEGALWTEESLPADTVLFTPLAIADPPPPAEAPGMAADIQVWLQQLTSIPFQVGGNRTLGRGFVRIRWAEASPKGAS